MRGSFLQKLQPSPGDAPVAEAEENCANASEGLIRDSINLIKRVAFGRRAVVHKDDIPDIAQEAALRLWKWREKFGDKSEEMTREDWDSFTARTAHNEINRYSSKRIKKNEVALDTAQTVLTRSTEGDADIEVVSLVRDVWQGICSLSLHQRRALLLHSIDLLVYFMQCGIKEHAIRESIDITKEEWERIVLRLPLSDREIAQMANSNGKASDSKLAAQAVKKARFDARKKLKRLRI
ncbi:MAG: hypothetical protein KF762_07155 [Acidobacteria bacterium]|nr:hypothetical protein [Acidobacteriota bacterium]